MKKNEMSGLPPGYLLLLPRAFRWIGVGLFGLALASGLANRWFDFREALTLSKPVFFNLLQVIMVVGLLFLSSARRKIEDERSIYLRFQAISHASLFAVTMFVITTLFGQDIYQSGFTVIVTFLGLYWFSNEMAIRFNWHEKYDQSREG